MLSYDSVAHALAQFVNQRKGNYLIYFPSYRYLEDVGRRFEALYPACHTFRQKPRMTEADREAFLAAFHGEPSTSLIGFAVLGGIFAEGINLVGERLVGVIVVGVGIPQVCLEREVIKEYYQEQTEQGYDYAYTFPGWNRVLQAVGRLIRSETDRGAVLLIDARLRETRYQNLFPSWWNPQTLTNLEALAKSLDKFWPYESPEFQLEREGSG